MIALQAPRPLWLAGETQAPEIVAAAYRAASQPNGLATFTGDAGKQQAAAREWLLK